MFFHSHHVPALSPGCRVLCDWPSVDGRTEAPICLEFHGEVQPVSSKLSISHLWSVNEQCSLAAPVMSEDIQCLWGGKSACKVKANQCRTLACRKQYF